MDAANLLKPMLARGELRCDRRHHARRVPQAHREGRGARAALPARAGRRAVASRTRSRILRGLKERYEVHHGVRIQDAAIVAAAMLSDRYIADRFLPDKAIDLDRRGRQPAAHRDRLRAHGARRDAAAHRAAGDRGRRAGQGVRPGLGRAAPGRRRRSSASCASSRRRLRAHWQREKQRHRVGAARSRAARGHARPRPSAPSARPTCSAPPSCATATCPQLEGELEAETAALRGAAGRRRGCSRRRSTPRTSPRSSAPGPASPSTRLMEGELEKLAPHRGPPARARGRPGRRDLRGGRRHPPLARGPARPEPPHRLLPVPRPDRRRQDRAREVAGRVHVRRREGDDPHRHVGVHGAATPSRA